MRIKPLSNYWQCMNIYFPNITIKGSHISCSEYDYFKPILLVISKLLNNIHSWQDIFII